ncbi:NB-ARC domain-containing protein [Argonema antarcticum]|uniref:NB-ARC domain-containing protein n=1 Tax=Argonema antarcticum TaxID=2942763 RepID=UPI0020121E9C|nr:NB-ARC domain-containing protein [Argonema antarcticum]MCL1469732.1 hypothetical protein [Argonema antarcticum A004/B2]
MPECEKFGQNLAMSRSLKVGPKHIDRVKLALKRCGFPSVQAFATEMGIAYATASKFFNGKPVDYLNFVEFSEKLGLDWRSIADIEADLPPQTTPETTPQTDNPSTTSATTSTANQLPPTPYENIRRQGLKKEQFIGREEELETLHRLLQQNQQVAITAAIVGMGGVGKTELAIQYGRGHLYTYQGGVCWLPAKNFAPELLKFARPYFFPKDNLDGFSSAEQVRYCWLHWAEGEVLLVVDDVTDYKQQVKPYLPESPRFKVLITTRERLGKPIERLDLNVLQPEAALNLLQALVGAERIEGELDKAKQLCEWLGYLPLGLELVGRYLEQKPDLSLEEMLSRLMAKRLKHKALQKAEDTMTAELGVRDAFELSWERLDENAQMLGCLLSLFALAPIPWSLVESVAAGKDPDVLEDARDDLMRLHLIECIDKDTYSLHQLIRQFLQEKLEESPRSNDQKRAFVAAMAALVMARVAKENRKLPTLEEVKSLAPVMLHLARAAIVLTEFLNYEEFAWLVNTVLFAQTLSADILDYARSTQREWYFIGRDRLGQLIENRKKMGEIWRRKGVFVDF